MERNKESLLKQLQHYIVYRLEYLQGTATSVISDIRIIEMFLAQNNIHSNCRKWKPIADLLAILPTTYPSTSQAKRAFRNTELFCIMQKIVPASIDSIMIRCLIAFGVSGALRASEYTSPVKEPSPEQAINIVRKGRLFKFKNELGKPSMIYLFFRSKKNQKLNPEFAVMPCSCQDMMPCAYHELARLESHIKKAHNETYLFVWADGSLVTYTDTLNCFKQASAAIGAKANVIGTHSARKARVVIGVKAGLPEHMLLLLGRWKSLDSVKPYLRMGPLDFSQALISNNKQEKQ